MIVVVEGISAAGKTTWCQHHATQYLIKESYPEKRPDRQAGPGEAARIWTDWNCRRWSEAVAMERDLGVAVCDTDPLKLHFIWAMRQIGEVAESHWTAQLKFTRQALYDRRLGFADRYLFKQCQRRSKSRPVWRSKTRPAAGLWCRHGNGPDRGHFHVGGDDFDQGVRISPVSRSTVWMAWFCSAPVAATRRRAADCFSR